MKEPVHRVGDPVRDCRWAAIEQRQDMHEMETSSLCHIRCWGESMIFRWQRNSEIEILSPIELARSLTKAETKQNKDICTT